MDDWFSEWDRDGDGQITRDELALGLQKLGVFLSVVRGAVFRFCSKGGRVGGGHTSCDSKTAAAVLSAYHLQCDTY